MTHRILALVDRVFELAIVVLMAAITAIIAADVVARYVVGTSILFAGELSRLCFIWVVFAVMPLGVARGLHVAITSVPDNVGPPLRRVLVRLGALLSIALMGVVLAGAVVSIDARSGEMMNTIPLSVAWFYYPLAIGAAWSIVHLLVQLVRGAAVVRTAVDTAETIS